jgi:hypothetical protein
MHAGRQYVGRRTSIRRTEVCGRNSWTEIMDGSLWTEVCGRNSWTKVCGRKFVDRIRGQNSWTEVCGRKFVDGSLTDESPWMEVRGRKSMDRSPTDGSQVGNAPSPSKATVLQRACELRGDGRWQRGAA